VLILEQKEGRKAFAERDKKGRLSLKDILELLELPTRGEVQKEGLNPDIETYRKVVIKVANAILGAVQLILLPTEEDEYELAPAAGGEWRDAAFHLGYYANLKAGSVVVDSSKAFLRYNAPEGGWPDFRAAVLGNLSLLRSLPEALHLNQPRATLLKALELIQKGPEKLEVLTAT
jgi:hypothetical protein